MVPICGIRPKHACGCCICSNLNLRCLHVRRDDVRAAGEITNKRENVFKTPRAELPARCHEPSEQKCSTPTLEHQTCSYKVVTTSKKENLHHSFILWLYSSTSVIHPRLIHEVHLFTLNVLMIKSFDGCFFAS